MEIHGEFNVQLFYDTLARILSERENVKITVKVIDPEKNVEVEKQTA